MRDVMTAIGVIITAAVVLSIPILFVCSIYENWPGFLKLLLLIFMSGDILGVATGVVNLMDNFE